MDKKTELLFRKAKENYFLAGDYDVYKDLVRKLNIGARYARERGGWAIKPEHHETVQKFVDLMNSKTDTSSPNDAKKPRTKPNKYQKEVAPPEEVDDDEDSEQASKLERYYKRFKKTPEYTEDDTASENEDGESSESDESSSSSENEEVESENDEDSGNEADESEADE